MALQLPNSVFFHVPKTGGTWVRYAVARSGIETNEVIKSMKHGKIEPIYAFHAKPSQVACHGRFRFAFVRHPFSYYQSYWAYRQILSKWNDFDRTHMHRDFSMFVRSVTNAFPLGWVSSIYRKYVGEVDHPLVDFVGKKESLIDDLITALRLAGEEFDEEAIRTAPKQNQASALDTWKPLCLLTPDLIDLLTEHEAWAMRKFGYQNDDTTAFQVASADLAIAS